MGLFYQQKEGKHMSNGIGSLAADLVAIAEELSDIANTKPVLLKALKHQDRFKLSSVWIQLANGKFQHLQSGRVTTASRLAGYTRVIARG